MRRVCFELYNIVIFAGENGDTLLIYLSRTNILLVGVQGNAG
jgi:hypothetical protein